MLVLVTAGGVGSGLMDRPRKRKNRAQRRAQQNGAAPAPATGNEDGWIVYDDGETPATEQPPAAAPPAELRTTVPRPPGAGVCPAWHYYWCDGHDQWHHHEEPAVDAIAASMTAAPEA